MSAKLLEFCLVSIEFAGKYLLKIDF
jgi:hypothetical protein